MKQTVLTLITLLTIAVVVISAQKTVSNSLVEPIPSTSNPSPSPNSVLGLSVNENQLKSFTVDEATYRATWVVIDNPDLIHIGVNQALTSSSSAIFEKEGCVSMTSGGFYGKDDLPIGLVIADQRELSPWQKNVLFDSVLAWDGSVLSIEKEQRLNSKWAVQAGPMLFYAGEPLVLTLKNDQPARRIVAMVTDQGQLILGVIVAHDSLFGGPYLEALPQLITNLETVIGIPIESAINLDGGTASAFVSDTVTLRELKPIGTWICVGSR